MLFTLVLFLLFFTEKTSATSLQQHQTISTPLTAFLLIGIPGLEDFQIWIHPFQLCTFWL